MASYPVETVAEPSTAQQATSALPRQRGAALGLAAMAVGASSVIGLAGPALAADRPEHTGPSGSLLLDEHATAAPAADAGTALADRIRAQATQQRADAETTARREAATAASAKAAAVERVRTTETLTLPVPGVSTTAYGQSGSYWSHLHTGLDFPAPAGTPVRAVGAGVVTSAGWAGSYGYRVIETLPDGTEIWYCHLSAIAVGAGSVTGGQPIGRVGSTGNSTGPHLHLEVRPSGGDPVDPTEWLTAHGVEL
ncbi:M23 family metallopeptidase [Streptacidiphilus rugosus]|uniref:M23 family metallopeptidase n=1 Tax=Streptacidiphilus rugosus TaxID=405783 RepID=UPI000689A24B|nr:M23 family metallopeptidase [Streptacidiphilus rugosus]